MDANHDPWGGTSTLTPDTDLADRYKPIPGSNAPDELLPRFLGGSCYSCLRSLRRWR